MPIPRASLMPNEARPRYRALTEVDAGLTICQDRLGWFNFVFT